jgi:SH3 domain-containing YSC84-like protein 1
MGPSSNSGSARPGAARGATTWRGPAFYTLGEASFGFQAGADAAEVMILAMTDRGLTKLLSASVKLGGDVSVAAGPIGGGVGAGTAGLSSDLIIYSKAQGLYGGFSVAKSLDPTDILIRGEGDEPWR